MGKKNDQRNFEFTREDGTLIFRLWVENGIFVVTDNVGEERMKFITSGNTIFKEMGENDV